MEYMARLGGAIADEWSRYYFDTLALPDIACSVLTKAEPHLEFVVEDVGDWLASTSALPAQPNIESSFGQPPLTVYWHPQFYIELLHWTTGTTEIHQHGFSGAFSVLAGSSLQSIYTFDCHRRINVHMLRGDLALESVSVLSKGDVRPIRSGSALIHSVFHLDYPSVTLVVRTPSDIDSKPQYNYFPPGLALDPSYRDALGQRRVQFATFLASIRSARLESFAADSLLSSGPLETYRLLLTLSGLCDEATMLRLVAVARRSHGELAEDLWLAVRESQRQGCLIRARHRVTSTDGRFLLALLLNVRSREEILRVVAQMWPSEDAIGRIQELVFGMPVGDVGIVFDDLNRSLFRSLLEGRSVNETIEGLGGEFEPSDVEAIRGELEAQCETLRSDSVFSYLLAC